MWEGFRIGFWHPFGPYTGLSAAEVIEWKRSEAETYGWTLWSFAYAPTAAAWLDQLAGLSSGVFAFCSDSPAAKDPDPHRGTVLATHYRYLNDDEWHEMPDPRVMKVSNPFKRRGLALAFKVRRVIPIPPAVPPLTIEWYSKGERRWRSDPLPTRGEFLIRRGGRLPPRRVSALLELAEPYLAILRCRADGGLPTNRLERSGTAAQPERSADYRTSIGNR